MNTVEIVNARVRDKPVVRRLLELYAHDFSEFTADDIGGNGLYGYPDLDNFWTEPNRRPFLFRVDDHWAGLALVRVGRTHDMQEFFVMRKYRRRGIGADAARAVFAQFPGAWQVRQLATNPNATTFWRRAIPYPFDEGLFFGGPVQRFVVD